MAKKKPKKSSAKSRYKGSALERYNKKRAAKKGAKGTPKRAKGRTAAHARTTPLPAARCATCNQPRSKHSTFGVSNAKGRHRFGMRDFGFSSDKPNICLACGRTVPFKHQTAHNRAHRALVSASSRYKPSGIKPVFIASSGWQRHTYGNNKQAATTYAARINAGLERRGNRYVAGPRIGRSIHKAQAKMRNGSWAVWVS